MNIEFFRDIEKAGGKALIVGGYVRDKLLNVPAKDADLEVFNLNEKKLEEILNKYGKFQKVGSFNIYLSKNVEVSLSNIEFGDEIENSIRKSAVRRDFTINALYYDPLKDVIYDFLDGQKHLKEKKLKCCSKNTFMNDPLRVLRLAYFSAKYNFEIEQELIEMLKGDKQILEIPVERIFSEFNRILELDFSVKAFEVLEVLGILKELIGENTNYYKFEKIRKKEKIVLWTVLALGNTEFPYFFLTDKRLIKEVNLYVKYFRKLQNLEKKFNNYEIKKIMTEVSIKKLLRIYSINHNNIEFIKSVYKVYLREKSKLQPYLQGKDLLNLGFSQDKNIGVVLKKVYDEQLKNNIGSKEDAIAYIKKNYKEFTKLC